MLSEEEKKKLLLELQSLKAAISGLREKIKEKYLEKEQAFLDKEVIASNMKRGHQEIVSMRRERDNLTRDVKRLKSERMALHRQVNARIEDIKKATAEKERLMKEHDIREDPARMERQIAQLEERIETSPMPLEAEKKVMKQIKDLRKNLVQAKGLYEVLRKMREMQKEINELKHRREETHRRIQQIARESQEKHEAMIERREAGHESTGKEHAALQRFLEAKKEYTELNAKLKEKLKEQAAVREKLDRDYGEQKKTEQRKQQDELKHKAEEVDEKLKKRRKLTTEDLLVFQKMAEEGKDEEWKVKEGKKKKVARKKEKQKEEKILFPTLS